MSDDKTIGVYDARAEEYARLVDTGAEATLARFMEPLPAGAHVLDLGCGPGQAAKAMAEAGMQVTAMDASAEMVRLASAIPGITVRQARFDELSDVEAYDGIWASFSLLHAPRTAFPGHLAALKQALKPDGRLYLGMKLGQGDKTDRLGRFYTYYGADELTDLLTATGFTVLDTHEFEVEGMAGGLEPCLSVMARG